MEYHFKARAVLLTITSMVVVVQTVVSRYSGRIR